MKNLIFTLALMGLCSIGFSQGEHNTEFSKKGKLLIETGYGLLAGFSTGSGLSIIDIDGQSVTSLAFDGGYFLSENLALKGHFSLLSSNGSLSNYGLGVKYYAGGKIPIEIVPGLISGNGGSEFLGNVNVGYAAKLAPNIYLEPTIGAIIADGSGLEIALRFAMIL